MIENFSVTQSRNVSVLGRPAAQTFFLAGCKPRKKSCAASLPPLDSWFFQ
jgi:hypothetical protein